MKIIGSMKCLAMISIMVYNNPIKMCKELVK